ncbi:MAG: hypothetical protein M0C28_39930 [Candidatus Moduliflexus flocculans]|nr:hypothetical protein [Candidatus Moduliflexus flocculans]
MAENWRPDSVPSILRLVGSLARHAGAGDGRRVVTNDKASHFNLTTYTQWKDYALDDRVKSRIMLHGLAEVILKCWSAWRRAGCSRRPCDRIRRERPMIRPNEPMW